jgi:hypothetical protein
MRYVSEAAAECREERIVLATSRHVIKTLGLSWFCGAFL